MMDVAGGLFVRGGKSGSSSTCCEKLNIGDNKWKYVAKVNEATKKFKIVSFGTFMRA